MFGSFEIRFEFSIIIMFILMLFLEVSSPLLKIGYIFMENRVLTQWISIKHSHWIKFRPLLCVKIIFILLQISLLLFLLILVIFEIFMQCFDLCLRHANKTCFKINFGKQKNIFFKEHPVFYILHMNIFEYC